MRYVSVGIEMFGASLGDTRLQICSLQINIFQNADLLSRACVLEISEIDGSIHQPLSHTLQAAHETINRKGLFFVLMTVLRINFLFQLHSDTLGGGSKEVTTTHSVHSQAAPAAKLHSSLNIHIYI